MSISLKKSGMLKLGLSLVAIWRIRTATQSFLRKESPSLSTPSGTTDWTGYILNSSNCGKAASLSIPRSIDGYVTGLLSTANASIIRI